MNAGVNDATGFPSSSFIIILTISILGNIHPMTYAQGKISGLVVILVIPDLKLFSYKARSPKPASGTFLSTSMG